MKKSRILGYALTLAATLMVGSAMGQANTTTANYVEIKASDANNARSFITTGETLGFFAVPDLAFHTSWTGAGNWKLNSGHTWTWAWTSSATGLKFNGDATGSFTRTATGADNDPANYVEITAGSDLGVHSINVKEGMTAALGGCSDGTGKTFDLVVFAKPTIAFASGGRDGKLLAAPCSMPDTTLKINITGTESFNVQFRMRVYNVTVDAATGDIASSTKVGQDSVFSATKMALAGTVQGGKPSTRITWTLAGAAFDYATTTANLSRTLTTAATKFINLPGQVITRYQFIIDNGESDGVNDFVTRKSSTTVYQGTSGQELNFYVKRAPVTGPVYHINNNVAKS